MQTQFDLQTRERIINRESECAERKSLMLMVAARAYKVALPRNEFMAQALDLHEADCDTCWAEAVAEHSGFCRHGAEACIECGTERMNL